MIRLRDPHTTDAILFSFFAIHIAQMLVIPVHEAAHLVVGTVALHQPVDAAWFGPAWGAVRFTGPHNSSYLFESKSRIVGPSFPIIVAIAARLLWRDPSNVLVKTILAIAPGIATVMAGLPLIVDGIFGRPSTDLARVYLAILQPADAEAIRWTCFAFGLVVSLLGMVWAEHSWRTAAARDSPGDGAGHGATATTFLTGLLMVGVVGVVLMGVHEMGGVIAGLRGTSWPTFALEGGVASIVIAASAWVTFRSRTPTVTGGWRAYSVILILFCLASWITTDISAKTQSNGAAQFMKKAQEADDSFTKGEFTDAARLYEELVKADSNQSYFKYQLGVSRFLAGRETEAVAPLKSVLSDRSDPQAAVLAPRAHYWLGRVELDSGNVSAACDHFRITMRDSRGPLPYMEDPRKIMPSCKPLGATD